MPDWQPVQPKPDLPDTDCLVVHGWPAADCCDDVIMGRCCCTLQNGVCACRLSFWQWPYARHSKIRRTSRNSGRLLMPEKQNLDKLSTFCGRKYGHLDVIQNPAMHIW